MKISQKNNTLILGSQALLTGDSFIWWGNETLSSTESQDDNEIIDSISSNTQCDDIIQIYVN